MALTDYFLGPKHKANALRLQSEYQELQARYEALEAKAKELGVLELAQVQDLIKQQQKILANLTEQVSKAETELLSAHAKLSETQQLILGAEERQDRQIFLRFRTPSTRL